MHQAELFSILWWGQDVEDERIAPIESSITRPATSGSYVEPLIAVTVHFFIFGFLTTLNMARSLFASGLNSPESPLKMDYAEMPDHIA